LSWDSTGYPEKNIVNITKDERYFDLLIKRHHDIIRIALHPRDPHSALEEQKQMIDRLKDSGYMMSTYSKLISKLQQATTTPSFSQRDIPITK
jgi:hypothetical protein